MSTKDFTANVISASKVVPDGNFKDSKASGIWDINEALDLIKGGNWPNAANINPSAFVSALFSIDLWTGNDTERTITTGLDMSTNGGLVWLKNRDASASHHLFNTVSGATYYLQSNNTNAQDDSAQSLKSFGTTGFTIGTNSNVNNNSQGFCSWSFRKQPKFFDVVTWTGTGSAMTIDHNLGQVPGMIIVKSTSATYDWAVWHREFTGTTDYIKLNTTAAKTDSAGVFGNGSTYLTPTSTQFFVGGNNQVSGEVGGGYVAYLFAHNNDDGGFGEPGDQDIIKCGATGTYTAGTPLAVNLGFEPQWILVKQSDAADGWYITDVMREMATDKGSYLLANSTSAENNTDNYGVAAPTPTGFILDPGSSSLLAGGEFIYMAIRRGGNKTPTAASDVFAVDTMANQTPAFDSTFPVDMVIRRNVGGVNTNTVWARITGQSYLNTNADAAAANDVEAFDSNVGFGDGSTYSDNHAYMWARARGYFDVVTYTGNSTNNHEIKHNLGVVPEMVWFKSRNTTRYWHIYHSATGNNSTGVLNTDALFEDNSAGFYANPTATSFFLLNTTENNNNTRPYIAYLFATVANVSKVGSFTQSGATNVDCGFTGSTPALIILKRTDSTGDWYLFDSLRGIVAGNDPYFILNDTTAPTTNADMVDPYSGGFATTSNIANGDYIFYAIAAIS